MPKPLQFGFVQYRDRLNEPVTAQNLPIVNIAIKKTLEEHQRQVSALLGLFSRRTTKYKTLYKTGADKYLQELDETGRARITGAGDKYDVAYPIMSGGDAWGVTFVQQQKLTIGDFNDWMYGTLTADNRFLSHNLLCALFAKDPWIFADPEHGELTVRPLANGDTQPYLIRNGQATADIDSHLLAQVDPISDAHNPFRLIRRDLLEHPENGGNNAKIIVLVSTDMADDIEEMAGFKEKGDPDVTAALGEAQLVADLDVAVPGIVRGKINQCWIVDWATMPTTHLLAVPYGAGGDPALAQREHEEATLQGFFEMPANNDSPYFRRDFARHTGFGVDNRVGALAMKFGDNTYTAPDIYKTPITANPI